jgi:hypothetical protein
MFQTGHFLDNTLVKEVVLRATYRHADAVQQVDQGNDNAMSQYPAWESSRIQHTDIAHVPVHHTQNLSITTIALLLRAWKLEYQASSDIVVEDKEDLRLLILRDVPYSKTTFTGSINRACLVLQQHMSVQRSVRPLA